MDTEKAYSYDSDWENKMIGKETRIYLMTIEFVYLSLIINEISANPFNLITCFDCGNLLIWLI